MAGAAYVIVVLIDHNCLEQLPLTTSITTSAITLTENKSGDVSPTPRLYSEPPSLNTQLLHSTQNLFGTEPPSAHNNCAVVSKDCSEPPRPFGVTGAILVGCNNGGLARLSQQSLFASLLGSFGAYSVPSEVREMYATKVDSHTHRCQVLTSHTLSRRIGSIRACMERGGTCGAGLTAQHGK